MNRQYVACCLLEHGPLTCAEFREITGWPAKAARMVLWHLMHKGYVRSINVEGVRMHGLA